MVSMCHCLLGECLHVDTNNHTMKEDNGNVVCFAAHLEVWGKIMQKTK